MRKTIAGFTGSIRAHPLRGFSGGGLIFALSLLVPVGGKWHIALEAFAYACALAFIVSLFPAIRDRMRGTTVLLVVIRNEGGIVFHRDIRNYAGCVAVELHRVLVSNPPEGKAVSLRFNALAPVKIPSRDETVELPLQSYTSRLGTPLGDPLNLAPGTATAGSLAWLWDSRSPWQLDGYRDIGDNGALRFRVTDLNSNTTVSLGAIFHYPLGD